MSGLEIDIEQFQSFMMYDRFMELLDTGKAAVFDKNESNFVGQIKVYTSSYTCGPMCGEGEKSYYLSTDPVSENLSFLRMMWRS